MSPSLGLEDNLMFDWSLISGVIYSSNLSFEIMIVNSLSAWIPNFDNIVVLSPYPSKFSTYASIGYAWSNEDSITSLIIVFYVIYFLGR